MFSSHIFLQLDCYSYLVQCIGAVNILVSAFCYSLTKPTTDINCIGKLITMTMELVLIFRFPRFFHFSIRNDTVQLIFKDENMIFIIFMNRSTFKKSAFLSCKCCTGFGILYPTSNQTFFETTENSEYDERVYNWENMTSCSMQSKPFACLQRFLYLKFQCCSVQLKML